MLALGAVLSLCVLGAAPPGAKFQRFLDIESVHEDEREAVKSLVGHCEFMFDADNVVGILSIGGTFDDETVKSLRKFSKLRRIVCLRCDVPDSCLNQIFELKQLRRLELHDMPSLTDESFASLAMATQLRVLDVNCLEVAIGDKTATEIAKLPKLRKLSLRGKLLTEAGFAQIGKVKGLRHLNLAHSQITDLSLAKLSSLHELRFLCLTQTSVTGSGFKELSGMQKLETLILIGSKFSDEHAAHLSAFKALKKLDLSGTTAGDSTAEQVGKLSELTVLDLWDTKLSDAGMPHIAKLEMLERLSIGRTKVSDKHLPLFYELARLEKVDIRYARATLAGIGELRKHMLDVDVEWYPLR